MGCRRFIDADYNNVSPLGVARPCPVDAARQRGAQTNLDAESIGYTGDIERRIFRGRPGGRHQAERRATDQRRAETMNAPSRVGLSQGLLRQVGTASVLKKLILVGCVKSKRGELSAAKDLYDSPLWRCRRAYAERSGVPWYILSAEHGLLAPETVIAPYDLALTNLRAADRRVWSRRVLDGLAAKVPVLQGITIEVHAGKAYADYGLEDGLQGAGAKVQRPLARVAGIGHQCAWYAERLRHA